jgi:hypothetical protein
MLKHSFFMALVGLLLAGTNLQAQTKIGLKIGPNLSLNRISDFADMVNHETFGSGLRFMIGPIVDFELTKNYYFSTGILFTSKRTALRFTDFNNTLNSRNDGQAPTLNYVSLPATLKLYTNEIDLDKKLYLQLGSTIDILTGQPANRYDLFERVWFMDFNLLIAAGLEYNIGIDTRVFGGFSYQRGLVNVVRDHKFNDQFRIWNDIISLEVGVKF